ncbi:DUF58 domain-containing protein [Treponema primitia]|uniref:DUF58 domain-containing protein n=1 Tax=Treponema primitia TaxID=88058 RepID=UPI0002555474|nr:DUF58 domain-containing protein [Treponema primitia]
MHESTGSRPSDLGIFLFILTILALGAGALRKELALTLVGGVFLVVLAFSVIAALILGGIHSKRARLLSSRFLNRNIPAGKNAEVILNRDKAGKGRFFRLPGILIRYEIRLTTRDGREIRHLFDPDGKEEASYSFPVPERGAYYGEADRFFIGDILGLFRFYLPLPSDSWSADKSPRILALPQAAAEPIPVYILSGGESQRQNVRYQRTDNLIDHRPYVPGDDPRRINWKLYGHAPSNELFVREGEPEPPPHSRLIVLVDTLTDPALYSPAAGRRSVDLLCENALAIALEYQHRGMELSIGYTGGSSITEGTGAELAEALAYPAAQLLTKFPAQSAQTELPASPTDRGILILALPRTTTEGALDRFLKKQTVDLAFLYEDDRLEEAAQTCVRLYSQRAGVHVRQIRLGT